MILVLNKYLLYKEVSVFLSLYLFDLALFELTPMKALLPLLRALCLFVAYSSKPSPPSDPAQDHPGMVSETAPPEFFEQAHRYTEIHPNVFSFEVLDDTGELVSKAYQVWGYEARQWYRQNTLRPQLDLARLLRQKS